MKTKTSDQLNPMSVSESGAMFDGWAAALAMGEKCDNDPSSPAPPSVWRDELSPTARACGWVVLTEPEPDGFSLGPWRRLRARFMSDQAENAVVTDKLKSYFVEDFEERARWQRAAEEIAAPAVGVTVLDLAARKLRARGGLLATLRAQRAALDAQIARLERVQVGV